MSDTKFIEISRWNFNGKRLIALLDDKGMVWFHGKQVAELMNYSDPTRAIYKLKNKFKQTMNQNSFKKSLCIKAKDNLSSAEDESSFAMGDKEKRNEIKNQFISSLWNNPKDTSNKTFISEPGFYLLAFTSKMQEAEKFTDWVVEDVLPSIRKTGKYVSDRIVKDQEEEINIPTVRDNIPNNHGMYIAGDLIINNNTNNNLANNGNSELELIRKSNAEKKFYNGELIRVYSTQMIAEQTGYNINKLNTTLKNEGWLVDNTTNSRDNLRFFASDYALNRQLAVKLPFDNRSSYPDKYYFRWTRKGYIVIINLMMSRNLIKNVNFKIDE